MLHFILFSERLRYFFLKYLAELTTKIFGLEGIVCVCVQMHEIVDYIF